MKDISLSVFFPCYNEEANVEKTTLAALEALRTITPDFEVIIVNDGSKDKTREIADRLVAVHPGFARSTTRSIAATVAHSKAAFWRAERMGLLHRRRRPVRLQRDSQGHRAARPVRHRQRVPFEQTRPFDAPFQRMELDQSLQLPARHESDGH